MSTFDLADLPGSWPVRESHDLHRDHFVMALRSDQVERPGHPEDGSFRRLVLEHPGASVVLAVDDDDRVFCLRQYRHPARASLVELPAGLLDVVGEDPVATARRELREEAGLRAERWTHLLSAYSSPGISAELIHYYLARDLTAADRSDFTPRHEEAEMTTDWVPFAELERAVLDGRVRDAPTVLAVLAARVRGLLPSGPLAG